jgi:hypothetical protein
MKLKLLAAAFLLAAMTADAAEYYMSPSGSDSNAGTLEKPWKSYRRAQQTLKPGDTLFARGGTYKGRAGGAYRDWKVSGTASAPITFRNYPGEQPVFDGLRGTSSEEGYFLIFDRVASIRVIGLKITRWGDEWGNGIIQFENAASDIIIDSNYFDDNGHDELDHHIYLEYGAPNNISVLNNYFGKATGCAIHFYHPDSAKDVQIHNNFFRDSHCGIVLADLATNIRIHHNTFVNNQTNISIDDHGSKAVENIQIHNNISYSAGSTVGLKVGSRDAAQVFEDCNLWHATNNTPIQWEGNNWTLAQLRSNTVHGDQSIQADPRLVSLTEPGLLTDSPAIDKACGQWGVSTDIDRTARPLGPAFDMGADEVR